MAKVFFMITILSILLFSNSFSLDKINEEKIKQIFEETEFRIYATSELKEKNIVFSASNLIDRKPDTCWATRINGGIEESILIFFTTDPNFHRPWQKGISILNGYEKNKNLYDANNRLKNAEIKIYRIIAGGVNGEIKYKRDFFLINNKLIEETNIDLYDEFSKQNIYYFSTDLETDVKNNNPDNNSVFYALVLTIKSVYKGSKYNDLCISEIRFLTNGEGAGTN